MRMKERIVYFISVGLLLANVAYSQTTHVVILDSAEITTLRAVVASDQRAGHLYDSVLQRARQQLDDQPRPLEKLYYEGLLETDPDRIDTRKSLEDMDKVIDFIYASYGSSDTAYARKVKQYILAWPTYISRMATRSTRISSLRCTGVTTYSGIVFQIAKRQPLRVG